MRAQQRVFISNCNIKTTVILNFLVFEGVVERVVKRKKTRAGKKVPNVKLPALPVGIKIDLDTPPHQFIHVKGDDQLEEEKLVNVDHGTNVQSDDVDQNRARSDDSLNEHQMLVDTEQDDKSQFWRNSAKNVSSLDDDDIQLSGTTKNGSVSGRFLYKLFLVNLSTISD